VDSHRFDNLVRALIRSRRGFVHGTLAATVGWLGLGETDAKRKRRGKRKKRCLLFWHRVRDRSGLRHPLHPLPSLLLGAVRLAGDGKGLASSLVPTTAPGIGIKARAGRRAPVPAATSGSLVARPRKPAAPPPPHGRNPLWSRRDESPHGGGSSRRSRRWCARRAH
jgi:hypothetical protein